MSGSFEILGLPLEIREQIYSFYFSPADSITFPGKSLELPENVHYDGSLYEYDGGKYNIDLRLYRASKQIKAEAEAVFRRENIFVSICTPWPQAGMGFNVVWALHITREVALPLVAVGERANAFKHSTAMVDISAASHSTALNTQYAEYKIILLLDDLHLFCHVWYYSALSLPYLNARLAVKFALADPYENEKAVPINLQKKLLLPFGAVKGLAEVAIDGADARVEQELRETMAIPYDPPQKCLETCTVLMQEGDATLDSGHAEAALALYLRAFKAMHILINGRQRRVLADDFFYEDITSGRYADQSGSLVRLKLRIALVSRVVSAYLHLQEWVEAAFWGVRSIALLDASVGTIDIDGSELFDEPVRLETALLCVRTGIAYHKMKLRMPKMTTEEFQEPIDETLGPTVRLDSYSYITCLHASQKYLSEEPAVEEQQLKVLKKECEAYGTSYSMNEGEPEMNGGGGLAEDL